MTTVAYDGKQLVTDSQCTSSFIEPGGFKKIIETDQGYYAVSGSAYDFEPIIEAHQKWMNQALIDVDGKRADTRETWPRLDFLEINPYSEVYFIPFQGGDTTSIIVDGSGSLRTVQAPPPVAMGSGSPYAMAVMVYGGSAEDAVRVASQLDPGTNDKLDIIDVTKAFEEDVKAVNAQTVVEEYLRTRSKKQTAENLDLTKDQVDDYLQFISDQLTAQSE